MYFPFRQWFMQRLLHGEFPIWNPYWGIGHEAVIWATVPVDIYSLIEPLIGPRYEFFFPIQCLLIVTVGYYVFRRLGFEPLTSALCSLLFFMSPVVTFWHYQFIKTNIFISHAFALLFMLKYYESRRPLYAVLLGWVFYFGMFGTKLEFWFFEAVFLGISAVIAHFIYRGGVKMVFVSWLSIAVAVTAQAWQVNLLVAALNNSSRSVPHGIHNLFNWEMYQNFIISMGDTEFISLAAVCGLVFAGIYIRNKYRWLILGLASAVMFRAWQWPFLSSFLNIKSPLLYGAAAATLMVIGKEPHKKILSAWVLFMLPAYYWCRPIVNADELYLLKVAPVLFKAAWGFLVFIGCLRVHDNKIAQLAYFSVIPVILLESQGQILLSYLFGFLWIEGRDGYLIDFSFALLAAAGTLTAFRLKPVLLRLAPFVIVFAAYPDIHYTVPSEPVPGLANPLKRLALDYNPYAGVPELREGIKGWDMKPYDRALDPDIENQLPQSQGTFLLERKNNASFYGSMLPARYNELIRYYNYGIEPEERVGSYPSVYSAKTISRLPKINTAGRSNGEIYYSTVWTIPPLKPEVLKLLGIGYITTRNETLLKPLMDQGALNDVRKNKGIVFAKLKDPLPRAFVIDNVPADKGKDFKENMMPKIAMGKSLSADKDAYIARPSSIRSYEPELVIIDAESATEGYLVLTDAFHPYWHAKVDGAPAEIIPAFHAFRAVRLSPGKHEIEFYCKAPRFKASFALSAIVLFLSIAVTVVVSQREKVNRHEPID